MLSHAYALAWIAPSLALAFDPAESAPAEYERYRKCAGSTDVSAPIVWFCVRRVAGWVPSSQQIGKDCIGEATHSVAGA